MADVERARQRFVYQELLVMQLALAVRRAEAVEARDAIPLPTSAKIDARIRRLFPFELTAGQNQVIAEIMADLARAQPTNRLLQGDVGSGKTVVAVYAMLVAVAHGAQAALMAPTELVVAATRPHARATVGRQPGAAGRADRGRHRRRARSDCWPTWRRAKCRSCSARRPWSRPK